MSAIDFAREGLLEGVDSAPERAARLELLEQLAAEGVSLARLKRAIADDRLALLPVELVFTRDCRYTIRELAEMTGLEVDFLRRDQLALGLPQPDPDERFFSDADVEGATTVRRLLDAGLSEQNLLELARVAGQGSARLAESVLEVLVPLLMRPGDTERDLGLRYADAALGLSPIMGPALATPLRQHLRAIIRREVVGRAERAAGRLPGSREVAVCFADLVGFTSLSEALDVTAVGAVAGRLATIAAEVATPRVRLVKMMGDAAMLVSPDAGALLTATFALVEGAETASDGFPPLRAGVAWGPAHALGRLVRPPGQPRQPNHHGSRARLRARDGRRPQRHRRQLPLVERTDPHVQGDRGSCRAVPRHSPGGRHVAELIRKAPPAAVSCRVAQVNDERVEETRPRAQLTRALDEQRGVSAGAPNATAFEPKAAASRRRPTRVTKRS